MTKQDILENNANAIAFARHLVSALTDQDGVPIADPACFGASMPEIHWLASKLAGLSTAQEKRAIDNASAAMRRLTPNC